MKNLFLLFIVIIFFGSGCTEDAKTRCLALDMLVAVVSSQDIEEVRSLIQEEEVDVNSPKCSDTTALMVASSLGYIEIVQVLLGNTGH